MQTFLPYSSFEKSAKCLDYRRLGKQRVEAWQIYQCLTGQGSLRWRNHPAVKMWKGYEIALLDYGATICKEWRKREFKDSMFLKFLQEIYNLKAKYIYNYKVPKWLGDEKFHASHRSNLLRKNYEWYSQFGWTESNNLPYIWIKND